MNAPLWFEKDDSAKTEKERAASLAERLDTTLKEIYESPAEVKRRDEMLFDLQLYFGVTIPSLWDLGMNPEPNGFDADELKFNHCYSICSTVRNRICSFRPRSDFVPSSGNANAKSGAEDLSAMNEAWSVAEKRQAKMALFMRDVLSCPGGTWKVYRRRNRIHLDRFPPWEVLIDEVDGKYGTATVVHHVQYLPVESVARTYDLDPDELKAEASKMQAGVPYASEREVIRVADSYAVAEDDENPGKHVILVGRTHIALEEEWEWTDAPIGIGVFEEGLTGVWGKSAVSFLRGIQTEQNEWTARMRDAHYNSSLQVWQLAEGEEGPTKITNENVRINRYSTHPAEVQNPAAMSPEAYSYTKMLEDQGYKTIGVSPFIAQGVKQEGVTSGIQQDATSELQSDRLALLSQLWETQNNDVDKWWMRLTLKAARDGVVFKWKAINKGAWRELAFDDGVEEWLVAPKATSVFGQTVSARLTKATYLLEKGAIDVEQWTEAVNMPDLKPITDIRLADQKLMERIVDNVLEKGVLRMPGPYLDPPKMYAYAKARYNLAEADDGKYPEAHMSKLRRLVDGVGRDAGIIPKESPPTSSAPAAPGVTAGGPAPPLALGAMPGAPGATGIAPQLPITSTETPAAAPPPLTVSAPPAITPASQ